jgi:hypothetical protein
MFAPRRPAREQPAAVEHTVTHERPVLLNEVAGRWLRLAGFTPQESRRLLFLRWLYRRGQLTEFPPER